MEADKKKTIRPYDSLLKLDAITPLFYNFVKTDVDIYYAAVMAHVPIYLFYEGQRKNKQPYLAAAYEKFWKEIYLQYPVMNAAALTSGNFYDYAQSYSSTYKNFYLLDTTKRKNLEADIKKTEGGYLEYLYQCLERDFTGPVKEYMLAYFLGFEMFQHKYQPELKKLFNRFVQTYPKSSFTASLQPWADEITRFQSEAAKAFTTDQVLMNNYNKINSVDELLSLYKDKTVYVDLWATWCGPCKGEFAYNKELKPQLKNKGVTMLYISMDELKAEEKWKTMIKYYDLTGQHLRANDSLKADLIKQLWDGKGYAIPRYLIIKNGTLINKDALRPSDKDKLYMQLQNSI